MNVLMVGVDKSTKGGMWTVVENYLTDEIFMSQNNLIYISTSTTGNYIKKFLFALKAYVKIMIILLVKNIDVVHVHMSERGSVYRKNIVMRMARLFGVKILLHMHGAEFEVWYKSLSKLKQKHIRKIINTADKIVILGEYLRVFICDLINEKSKICVVYNAVNIPKTYMYSKNSKNILFLGAITKRKGIIDFLEALKDVPLKYSSQYRVKIYGTCTEVNIEKSIKENGLDNWVYYCGWLDREKKKQILHDTAINILPSYNEGLPMTILETMAYGIPSITTNIAAIPEVVDKDNGYLIKPGDIQALTKAIEDVLEDKNKRIKKSKNAYKTIKDRFSIRVHIDKIQKLYEELTLDE